MVSEEEQAHLAEIKKAVAKVHYDTYQNLSYLAGCDEAQLKHTGWGGNPWKALQKYMNDQNKKIEKLIQDHEKKFPH